MTEQTDESTEESEETRADEYEFNYQDDGTVTARHLETGIVASGSSYAEALVDLTDVLKSDEHDVEPIEDPEAFLESLDLPSLDDDEDDEP